MKNLIAELLVKLAEREEESKELVAQVEALEIVVTALWRRLEKGERTTLVGSIEGALDDASPEAAVPVQDTELLRQCLKKLLSPPRN